jgi:hypothetical protein
MKEAGTDREVRERRGENGRREKGMGGKMKVGEVLLHALMGDRRYC